MTTICREYYARPCRFEYLKKNLRETGPALVGVELGSKADYSTLIQKMDASGIEYEEISGAKNDKIYSFLV